MSDNIKQLKKIYSDDLGEKLTEEELFDVSDRLRRLSVIAYKQMMREKHQSTEAHENAKI